MTFSNPPNNFPPTNTAGNCTSPPPSPAAPPVFLDSSLTTAASPSSSTSYTGGFTPRPCNSLLMTWHMQQPRRPITMTAFSETIRSTSVGSAPALDSPSLTTVVGWSRGPAGRKVLYGIAWCIVKG